LIVERVDYLQVGFGSEMLLGLRTSNDFGPVVTFGGGGLDVEYVNVHLKTGHNLAILPSSSLSTTVMKEVLGKTAIYGKIAEEFRGQKPLIQPEKLLEAIGIFQTIGQSFSLFNQKETYTIEELEINPLVMADGNLLPLDGLCRFSRRKIELAVRQPSRLRSSLNLKRLLSSASQKR